MRKGVVKSTYIASILLSLVSIVSTNIAAAPPIRTILSADTNHDGVVDQSSIASGKDLVLIKENPAFVTADDVVFQTNNYNLYIAAHPNDLAAPGALNNLRFGKITSDGTIKVYTLPNIGYEDIQVVAHPNNQKEILLVGRSGKTDRVISIQYQTKYQLPYGVLEAKKNKKQQTEKH